MHRPPSVDYAAGQSRGFLVAWLVVWAAALAIDLAWLLQAAPGDRLPWIGLGLTLIGAAATTRLGWITGNGSLVWDGQEWWWEHDRARIKGAVSSELDLQHLLLLRFVPERGGRRWFLLERATDAARWLDLRRAVHGSAGWGKSAQSGPTQARNPDRLIEP